MLETATFTEHQMEIEGIPMIGLRTKERAYALDQMGEKEAYTVVGGGVGSGEKGKKARSWKRLEEGLRFVPFFARGNRGGAGRVRTALLRVDERIV